MQPSDFGTGESPNEVTYQSIAAQIRSMNPRALTPNVLDSALTMIEYLREQALKIHDANVTRAQELCEFERTLMKRERDLAIAQRAADLVLKKNAPRKIYKLWR